MNESYDPFDVDLVPVRLCLGRRTNHSDNNIIKLNMVANDMNEVSCSVRSTKESKNDDSTGTDIFAEDVTVIDLMNSDHDMIVRQIAHACATIGFFHVVNHGISTDLIQEFRYQCQQYFTQFPTTSRDLYRRNENNARGYFDNEYTKQRLDWKYALDIGVPGSRDWNVIPDNDKRNYCLDGYNQIPTNEELPNFRSTIVSYFHECANLSHQIATLMTEGVLLHLSTSSNDDTISTSSSSNTTSSHQQQQLCREVINDLSRNHTSYLRMNYYPPCPDDMVEQELSKHNGAPPFGISPHRDAGFLTILLQDDECYSLQVPTYRGSSSSPDQSNKNKDNAEISSWRTVIPIPGGLTINTGDMAQIWSNGLCKAPLHRVLTHPNHERYSAPFFYNPGYNTWIHPIGYEQSTNIPPSICESSSNTEDHENDFITQQQQQQQQINYHPCLWGYFRAIRFAGDVTDLGVEIQVEDYLLHPVVDDTTTTTKTHRHILQQTIFSQQVECNQPFSVHQFRQLFGYTKKELE